MKTIDDNIKKYRAMQKRLTAFRWGKRKKINKKELDIMLYFAEQYINIMEQSVADMED